MRHQDQRDPYHGLTPEILIGQGIYANLERQLTYLAHVLQLLARLALEAFLALPGSSAPSFGTIVQGATETYSNFIDWLWDAVMNHPDLNDESKPQMFRTLSRMIYYAWLAQKQEGGVVEHWLDERGPSLVLLSNPGFAPEMDLGAVEPERC